jgi:MoaA/NifB/PqqE/SkfB family radical SAM enzyme
MDFKTFYKDYIESSTRINVDATIICPLQCPFCMRQTQVENTKKLLSKADHISIDCFNKLIAKYKSIALVGSYSDSIYHPKFIELIKIASQHPEIYFSISTNGTRKKLAWWKEVFKYSKFNIRWIFGLDGTDQETANIYRVNTRFDEVMEVMKLGVSMGVKVDWQFIMFKHNEHQIEEAKRIARENKINLLLVASSWWIPKSMEKNKIYPPSDESLYSKTVQSKFIRIHSK